MRITIIGVDGSVGVDGTFCNGLNLSQCGLPANFWAFQWGEHGQESGHIEYNSPMIQNETVTKVPVWATACIAVWQARLDQEAAEFAAAQAQNESQS